MDRNQKSKNQIRIIMETHDIFIGAIIILILSVQFAVFFVALKKIKLFKRIIPYETNFRMVKVLVPESQIKDLSVRGILEKQSRYSDAIAEEQHAHLEPEEDTRLIDDMAEEDYLDEWDEEETAYEDEHPETEIWIAKDNEEKKIQYQFLKSHEASGWTRIDY